MEMGLDTGAGHTGWKGAWKGRRTEAGIRTSKQGWKVDGKGGGKRLERGLEKSGEQP